MVDVLLLARLRALAAHRRWLLGLTASTRYRRLTAALVAVEGSGLASRVEVLAHRRAALPPEIAQGFLRLRRGRSPADAALLAARLAECQAALVDEFSGDVAPIWQRVAAIAVDGPGLWRRAHGLAGYTDLCDAARLADATGLNVIDGFPHRDIAQDGRGRPLAPIPLWLLLHDARKSRLFVEIGRRVTVTYLPASRDATGAQQTRTARVKLEPAAADAAWPADGIVESVRQQLVHWQPIDELVLGGSAAESPWGVEIATQLGAVPVVRVDQLGIDLAALRAAVVAVLGLFHLDQVPANASATTGARTPRVLGRLTPGSIVNWQRLLRELATRRPSVVTLRSAV